MLFQLPIFFAFLAVLIVAMMICPRRHVLPLVLVASLFFYAWWYPPYVLLLVGLIAMSWALTRIVRARRRLLPLAVGIALSPLLLFKYGDFVLANIEATTGFDPGRLGWLLPLGISFVTFTIISLIVDAVRRTDPLPSALDIAVYVSFFPHLIAGPILRSHQLIPQLPDLRLRWDRAAPALTLFAAGMLKKVLIADPVGATVDQLFAASAVLSPAEAALAMLGFAVQIYCDFSAYSDMAIALAAFFGIQFPENFRSPYLSTCMSEIWRRWHITLSTWLRDYVMVPLHRRLRHAAPHAAIFLTMVVSGLWHGAAWTFVVWGAVQGVILTIEAKTDFNKTAMRQTGLHRVALIASTFILWAMTTTIFRASSFTEALQVYRGLLAFDRPFSFPDSGLLTLALCGALLVLHPWDQVDRIQGFGARLPAPLVIPLGLTVVLACSLIAAGRPQAFYYFDF
ncbi:MBOAT family O-acyltransferase [Consotaella aegiceratis]|uniref:MBOAT family O-acyltransferase n=1 Tax=Consotaella aegiceratis TaxID=3097961 RepID=UPI002F41E621